MIDEIKEENQEEALDGIFTNKDEVLDGIRKSAEAVGLDPKRVVPDEEKDKIRYYARKSCKKCYGRGFLVFVPSPQKEKIFWESKAPMGYFRQRRRTPKKRKLITGFCPPNEELSLLWDDRKLSAKAEKHRGTSRPEPDGYKREAVQNVRCSCLTTESVV